MSLRDVRSIDDQDWTVFGSAVEDAEMQYWFGSADLKSALDAFTERFPDSWLVVWGFAFAADIARLIDRDESLFMLKSISESYHFIAWWQPILQSLPEINWVEAGWEEHEGFVCSIMSRDAAFNLSDPAVVSSLADRSFRRPQYSLEALVTMRFSMVGDRPVLRSYSNYLPLTGEG